MVYPSRLTKFNHKTRMKLLAGSPNIIYLYSSIILMTKTILPTNETGRLAALDTYLLTPIVPEPDYDEITSLAAQICGTPISLITLLGEETQWFKSHFGTDLRETGRAIAFCSHAIVEHQGELIVNDARLDERFSSNPLVTGDTNVIFYAGVSLVNPEGFALGTLCVIGHEPQELSDVQITGLRTLAKHALVLMEMRRKTMQLEQTNLDLSRKNAALQEFARRAVHDIKNPLTSIILNSQALSYRLKGKTDDRTLKLAEMNVSSAKELTSMINQLLEESISDKV